MKTECQNGLQSRNWALQEAFKRKPLQRGGSREPKNMKAGKFNRKLTLQAPAGGNNYGTTTEDWGTVASVWARVEPTAASESFEGGVIGETVYDVTIRYRAGVKSYMRFLYGEQILNIVGPPMDVDEDGTRVLQMSCVAKERG